MRFGIRWERTCVRSVSQSCPVQISLAFAAAVRWRLLRRPFGTAFRSDPVPSPLLTPRRTLTPPPPSTLIAEWMSQKITYGTFLAPHPAPTPSSPSPDPLAHDPALLSVVTLSAMIPQRTPREILWHLRGALRNGMTREEATILQESIEELCGLCGVRDVGRGMPRVADVERQKEEK